MRWWLWWNHVPWGLGCTPTHPPASRPQPLLSWPPGATWYPSLHTHKIYFSLSSSLLSKRSQVQEPARHHGYVTSFSPGPRSESPVRIAIHQPQGDYPIHVFSRIGRNVRDTTAITTNDAITTNGAIIIADAI